MGAQVCNFSAEDPKVADNTWGWNLQVRAHTSYCPWRAPNISLPIRQISPISAPIWTIKISNMFFWQIYIIAINMEWNGPVVGQILHFGPFPLKKISKRGAKKVRNQPSPNLNLFSNPRMIWYHKGSPPALFWDEKRPWLGRDGLQCGNSVPNFKLDFYPDHWGGPFGPKLHEPSSCINQTWFA
jgi:hypothetical protein